MYEEGCDMVARLKAENIKLKRSNNIYELQARDRRQQIRQLQAELEKVYEQNTRYRLCRKCP